MADAVVLVDGQECPFYMIIENARVIKNNDRTTLVDYLAVVGEQIV